MINGEKCTKTKLSVCSFGVAFGVAEGLFTLLLAWSGWLFGYGTGLMEQLGGLYHGFAPTFMGGLFGGIEGFVVGFLFGIVAGWVYNFCLCYCCRKCSTDNKGEGK